MIARQWLMDEWRDAFLMELRLRDVPGDRCGEALAEIDAHCADSGQSPAEAFGDPVRYAELRAASVPRGQPGRWRVTPIRGMLTAFATVGGVVGLLEGVVSIAHGQPGALTLGQLASMSVAPLAALAIALVLRPGRRRWLGLTSVLIVGGAAAIMTAPLLWRDELLRGPGWAFLAGGLLLLVPVCWLAGADGAGPDPVVDPRTGREPFHTSTAAVRVVRFGLPIGLLIAVVVLLFTGEPPR